MEKEIVVDNLTSALEIAKLMVIQDYVIMLSREENLFVINYLYSQDSDRNCVTFALDEELEEEYLNDNKEYLKEIDDLQDKIADLDKLYSENKMLRNQVEDLDKLYKNALMSNAKLQTFVSARLEDICEYFDTKGITKEDLIDSEKENLIDDFLRHAQEND